MKTRFAVLFLTVSLLFSGCIQPYTPPGPGPIVGPTVLTPKAAFDQYTLETAANYRALAQRCLNGEFEYVVELVDAAHILDKASQLKRNYTINQMVGEAIGADELDKNAAASVLLKIADDLDPTHKVQLQLEPKPAKAQAPALEKRPAKVAQY